MVLPEEVPDEATHLFALEPDVFVAERDALARRLRDGGQATVARIVKGLRRPTVAAHALNRAARAHPDLVAAVERSGTELARVQRRALSGIGGADVRGAVRAHRDDIDRLLAAVDPPVGPDAEAALRQTLLALAVDERLAAAVRRGVLSRPGAVADASAALSFGSPLGVVADPAPTSEEDPEDTTAVDEARRAAQAAVEREAAQRAVAEAGRRVDQRTTERVATQRRLRRAAVQVETARAAVVEAATALEQARQRVQQADAALAGAEQAAGTAARDVEEAEQADRRVAAAEVEARTALEDAARRLDRIRSTDV